MRPGAPRAAAGGEPCHGSIIAFWTCPLSNQGRDLRGLLGLSQTTAPDMPGSQKGLPPPACPASRKLEEPRSIPRRALWVGLRGRERRGGAGLGRGVAWPQSDFLCALSRSLQRLWPRAPGALLLYRPHVFSSAPSLFQT